MEKLNFQPISTSSVSLGKQKPKVLNNATPGFQKYLHNAVESTNQKLIVSKHAQSRMNQRNINIDAATWNKIESQLKQARKMGVSESLVITDQAALVISAKNNTVITAMDREEASSQIFTNINGTILIE